MAETEFLSPETLHPTERTLFIERTGVILRWILIDTCSIIQFVSPVIPFLVYWIALPIALLYNGGIQFFIKRKPDWIRSISYFSAVGEKTALSFRHASL